jgi:hypothetical protein
MLPTDEQPVRQVHWQNSCAASRVRLLGHPYHAGSGYSVFNMPAAKAGGGSVRWVTDAAQAGGGGSELRYNQDAASLPMSHVTNGR